MFFINNKDYKLPNKNIPKELKKYINDWFKDVVIDKKIGNALEQLFSEDNYIYGVHRTTNIEIADKIYEEGLILTGHNDSGAFSNEIDLDLNISFKQSFTNKEWDYAKFLRDILSSSNYKYALGNDVGYAMIVKISQDKVSLNNGESKIINNDILYNNGTNYILKPEYIVGKIEIDSGNIYESSNTEIKGIDLTNHKIK